MPYSPLKTQGMKVKVIDSRIVGKFKMSYPLGAEFELPEERAVELAEAGYVELVKEPAKEVVVETKTVKVKKQSAVQPKDTASE